MIRDSVRTHDEMVAAATEAHGLVPTALLAIEQLLHAMHRRSYSLEFIRLVHGLWAEHLCHDVVHRRHAKSTSSPDKTPDFLIPTGKPRYPSDTTSTLTRAELIDLMLNRPSAAIDVALRSQTVPDIRTPLTYRVRNAATSTIAHRVAPVWVSHPYLPTSPSEKVRRAIRTRRVVRWWDFEHQQGESCDPSPVRLAVVRSSDGESIDALIRRLVAMTLPLDLGENLTTIESSVHSRFSRMPRLMYTANAQHYMTGFKVAAAIAKQEGSRLLIHQHGGGYGIDEWHAGEVYDRSVADTFYTFGWNDDAPGCRATPLPVPPRSIERRSTGTAYLLMSVEYTTEFFRFQSFCLPTHAESCVSETVEFTRGLSAATRLTFRSAPALPFPVERIAPCDCTIEIAEAEAKGVDLAAEARLVIHNYLGTSWLETLAMNVPTVCFYDPAIYRPREAARPFLEQLARVGIIHYSGREAAKFVNGFNGDPSAWWNSAEVQEAREAFVARYANFSDNWLDAWLEEFDRLLSE